MPYSRTKEKRLARKAEWPDLRYGPNGEEKLFFAPHEVPIGWTKKPDEKYVPPGTIELNREELISKLQEKGITINWTWSKSYMKSLLND